MEKLIPLTGDQAAAEAMRQINPDVVAAYPITPQTEIVMTYSQFAADGLVDTEMIPVESEHSAMSACVGASAAGARAMTATSANGLALMWEVVYIAASTRLPIVMPVANRALSGPINIHCDHSDTMGVRDSGWIQIYCENAQEVYESIIMAVRIAEHPKILLPVMVCQDGFITSHAVEGIKKFEDKAVSDFVGRYNASFPLLDIKKPVTYGPLDLQDYYFEHKRQQSEAVGQAKAIIPQVVEEFAKLSGKKYAFIEEYKMEGAEVAILALSSTCGTTKVVVDELRDKGVKAGLVKLRFFRPFPAEEIIAALSGVKAVAVLDRSESFSNHGGPVFNEVRSALYQASSQPLIVNYIYGLGGRDINTDQIGSIYGDLLNIAGKDKAKRLVNYLGVRQ
jgi:pyruvate ferredoxin oxidoreductase alpha subunit